MQLLSVTSALKDVRANCFCASLLLRTQIHRPLSCIERALNTKMNNDSADGHCHSFCLHLTILDVR